MPKRYRALVLAGVGTGLRPGGMQKAHRGHLRAVATLMTEAYGRDASSNIQSTRAGRGLWLAAPPTTASAPGR